MFKSALYAVGIAGWIFGGVMYLQHNTHRTEQVISCMKSHGKGASSVNLCNNN